MSAAEADRFIADVHANAETFAEVRGLAEAGDPQQAYSKVRAMGYDATSDEIREALLVSLAEQGVELTDEQLAQVAGGLSDTEILGVAVVAGVAVVVVASSAAAAI